MKTAFSVVVFPLAGIAAALVTMCVPGSRLLSYINPFGSLFFGAAMALCMWLLSGLRSVRKTIIFLCGSFVAAVAGMLSAVYVTVKLFEPGPLEQLVNAPIAFTGGFVGAFVLMAAAIACFSDRSLRVLIQSACWALAGGALAAFGNASGDWFQSIRSHFDFMRVEHANPLSLLHGWHNEDLALLLIWQTGMGLVIALSLWVEQKKTDARQSGAAAKAV